MSDDELSPETEAALRALLAEARVDEPVPHDVAARLDAALTDLREERRTTGGASVVPLHAHRRRTATRLLVAAAAIVVGGVGFHAIRSSTTGTAADSGGQALSESRDTHAKTEAGGADNGQLPQPSAPLSNSTDLAGGRGVVTLRKAHFATDVERVLLSDTLFQAPSQSARSEGCGARHLGRGVRLDALYGRARGVLVVRAPRGDTQVADLYLCGTSEPARSVTLPTP